MQSNTMSKVMRSMMVAGLGLLLSVAAAGVAQAKEFVLGFQCDRSGPTQTVGAFLCDGVHDYFRLVNKQGKFGAGNSVRVFEIDIAYNTPRGVEAYERHKAAGALTYMIWGTPITYALTPKLHKDHIPGTSPGFGSAGAANGKEFPYLFPMAATYWSQMAGAVKFMQDKWKAAGKSGQPKVAYLFYDNPAGREPLPVLRDLQKQLGFTLREFAVPPPAVEMRPQVLDIVRNYKADWVITHLFGRAPGISIKELSRLRFPMNRIISFVWGGAEADINVAGWKTAQGYQSLQFAGVGQDHQIIRDIKKMYQDEGKAPPMDKMKISVFYNRGILIGAFHAEAIANAIKKHGNNITGEHTKEGFENIRNFSMGNFAPPVSVTPEDHEGGGWVQVWEVKGDKWVPASKWMAPYRDVVMKHVRATKYKK